MLNFTKLCPIFTYRILQFAIWLVLTQHIIKQKNKQKKKHITTKKLTEGYVGCEEIIHNQQASN